MKNTNSFFAGTLLGIVFLAASLMALGLTPKAEKERILNEAVAAGVAEWIVSYDNNGHPVLEFKWKQLEAIR